MTLKYYILDKNGEPVPSNLIEWGFFMQYGPIEGVRRVGRTKIGKSLVSTVFLGMNHNWNLDGIPHIWETLVMGGPMDQEMDRCGGSREQAMAMHLKMVKRVKQQMKETTHGDMDRTKRKRV